MHTNTSRKLAAVNVTGFHLVTPAADSKLVGEEYLAAFVAEHGPVSISLDAMTQLWWSYKGGVMTGCCNSAPDHAVLIVGFGKDAKTNLDYWLIKNSWGSSWGEGGYLRLQRGTNECNLLSQPVIPTVLGGDIPAPPPPPPPPPPPAPAWECPKDAKSVNTSVEASCIWTNGTAGFLMPPVSQAYCTYISSGYFGYTFEKAKYSADTYPCPLSAELGTNSKTNTTGEWFCTITSGSRGVTLPKGVTADCDTLESAGVFGYTWK